MHRHFVGLQPEASQEGLHHVLVCLSGRLLLLQLLCDLQHLVWGLGVLSFWVSGLWFRILGGLGFRIWGLGFRSCSEMNCLEHLRGCGLCSLQTLAHALRAVGQTIHMPGRNSQKISALVYLLHKSTILKSFYELVPLDPLQLRHHIREAAHELLVDVDAPSLDGRAQVPPVLQRVGPCNPRTAGNSDASELNPKT